MIMDEERDSIEVMESLGTMSKEDSVEIKKFNLVPAGKYTGLLSTYKVGDPVKTEAGTSPFEGKRITRLDFILNGETRDYHLFVAAYPQLIKATSKAGGKYIPQECQVADQLFAALEMYGQDFTDVLNRAQETSLRFAVGISEPKDPQYRAKNTVKIYAVKG